MHPRPVNMPDPDPHHFDGNRDGIAARANRFALDLFDSEHGVDALVDELVVDVRVDREDAPLVAAAG
jgi:hypothetical protein